MRDLIDLADELNIDSSKKAKIKNINNSTNFETIFEGVSSNSYSEINKLFDILTDTISKSCS